MQITVTKAALFALTWMSATCHSLEQMNRTQMVQGYRNAVAYIECDVEDAGGRKDTITGTGFVVNKGGYLLTTLHVVPTDGPLKATAIRATLSSRNSHYYWPLPVDIFATLKERDLVLLRFRGNEPLPNELPIAGPGVAVDQDTVLYALGFPRTEDLAIKEGHIDAFNAGDGGWWNTSTPFTYGMSGGPVLDGQGRVIGVTKGGLEGIESVRYVIPIAHAKPLLDQIGVRYIDGPLVPSSPDAALAIADSPGLKWNDFATKTYQLTNLKPDEVIKSAGGETVAKTFYPSFNNKFVTAHVLANDSSVPVEDLKVEVAHDGSSLTVKYISKAMDALKGLKADLVTTEAVK